MNVIFEWIRYNYGMIIFFLVILFILFSRSIIKFFIKKSVKKEDEKTVYISKEPTFDLGDESGLFDDIKNKDTLDNFQEQKVSAEKQIMQIKEEGKKLIKEEQKFVYEYKQKKARFASNRKQLGMKYTTWMNQLKMVESMIENQIHIEEEFKKMEVDNT